MTIIDPHDDATPDNLREHLIDLAEWISSQSELDVATADEAVDMYLAEQTRLPTCEATRTDAGWHGRVLGANGEPVWTTEVLTSLPNMMNAYAVLRRAVRVGVLITDKRTDRG